MWIGCIMIAKFCFQKCVWVGRYSRPNSSNPIAIALKFCGSFVSGGSTGGSPTRRKISNFPLDGFLLKVHPTSCKQGPCFPSYIPSFSGELLSFTKHAGLDWDNREIVVASPRRRRKCATIWWCQPSINLGGGEMARSWNHQFMLFWIEGGCYLPVVSATKKQFLCFYLGVGLTLLWSGWFGT